MKIEKLLGGTTEGFTDMIKCKDVCYTFEGGRDVGTVVNGKHKKHYWKIVRAPL